MVNMTAFSTLALPTGVASGSLVFVHEGGNIKTNDDLTTLFTPAAFELAVEESSNDIKALAQYGVKDIEQKRLGGLGHAFVNESRFFMPVRYGRTSTWGVYHYYRTDIVYRADVIYFTSRFTLKLGETDVTDNRRIWNRPHNLQGQLPYTDLFTVQIFGEGAFRVFFDNPYTKHTILVAVGDSGVDDSEVQHSLHKALIALVVNLQRTYDPDFQNVYADDLNGGRFMIGNVEVRSNDQEVVLRLPNGKLVEAMTLFEEVYQFDREPQSAGPLTTSSHRGHKLYNLYYNFRVKETGKIIPANTRGLLARLEFPN